MGYQLPNGSKLQISKTLETAIDFTSVSNAAEGALTVAANSGPNAIAKGDVVMITECTNPLLMNAVLYVKDATATSITLLNEDTTNATDYPAGIVGKVAKVSEWTDLPYVTNIANSGGDSQTTSFQPIQADSAINLFTTKNALTTALTMTHDSTDAIRPMLTKYDRSQQFFAYRIFNSRAASGKGEYRLAGAQLSFQEIPAMEVNSVETVVATLSLQSKMRFYVADTLPKP